MSSFEHKKGKTPDVSHLRIWGSKCYANVALSHRRKDFAPRAQEGYLVGYSEIQRDAYQIWVPETNRIVVSRSVTFDEAIPQGDVDFGSPRIPTGGKFVNLPSALSPRSATKKTSTISLI
jgi:hypothetical protein